MIEPDSYSYPRYLRAKRTVDARSLNRRVWEHFLDALPDTSSRHQILEVGGGIGATFQRLLKALLDKKIGATTLHYTLVDREPANIRAAREQVTMWAKNHGYDVDSTQEGIRLSCGPIEAQLTLVTADLFAFVDRNSRDTFDVVIGQAVLDLLNLRGFFNAHRPILKEGGLWYLPIHFDGVTGFEPRLDPQLDDHIERLYHESMGGTDEEGGRRAHTGRQLLTVLREQGDQVLAAGASDWVVYPRQDGYQSDEEYFLHHIIHFIEEELSDHSRIEKSSFQDWIQTRRHQIHDGELIYIAHQLDVLARHK